MKLYGDTVSELGVRETQLAALEVLKQIDMICRHKNLRYWIMFGSLIGAVRHQGFIPWDDDLDIAMPRGDYERLMAYFAEHASELSPLVAVKPEIGLNRPFLITRISDTRYKQMGEYGDVIEEMGAFVDIYPLDGLGSDREQAIERKGEAFRLVASYLRANNFEYNNRGTSRIKRAAKRIQSLVLGDPVKYQRSLFELCGECAYESSVLVSNVCWTMTPDKSIYERSWFDSSEAMPFEDMEVPVPAGYDALLRCDYGDYMQLPPETEQVGHHFYSIVQRQGDHR